MIHSNINLKLFNTKHKSYNNQFMTHKNYLSNKSALNLIRNLKQKFFQRKTSWNL